MGPCGQLEVVMSSRGRGQVERKWSVSQGLGPRQQLEVGKWIGRGTPLGDSLPQWP